MQELINDLHYINEMGETPDGDGVTINVQLWAERWIKRLESDTTLRNAKRYMWLRENCGYSGSGNHTGAQVIVYYADAGDGKHGIAYTGPTQRVGIMALDDAIDAAMKGANA